MVRSFKMEIMQTFVVENYDEKEVKNLLATFQRMY